jgi:hypothetical protein
VNSHSFRHQSGNDLITARLTPWDQRALGFVTAELTGLSAGSVKDATALLKQAESWARENNVRYLFGRVPANAYHVRRALSEQGHAMVECSLTLSRDGFAGLPPVPARMRPQLCQTDRKDLPTLQAIANRDFNHGRFLEDPAIAHEQAVQRTVNWLGDLFDQGLLQTAKSGARIVGFHAERITADGRHADLILTGTASRYAVLAVPLWISALDQLAERRVESCATLVSAANTGVVNLYAKLGFHYDSTLFGYRKFL